MMPNPFPSPIPKWDPAVLLQIHNPEAQGWSCKGITQSGRRCRRPLSQSKRDAILLLLPKLSPLPPKNPVLDEEYLEALSQCCFCYDHDDDDMAEEIMDQWEKDLMRARSVAEDGTRRFTFTGGVPAPNTITASPSGRHILTPRRLLNNPYVKSEQEESAGSGIPLQTPPLNQSSGSATGQSREIQPGVPNKAEPSSPQPVRIKQEREEEIPREDKGERNSGSPTEETPDHHNQDAGGDKKEDLDKKISVLKELRDEEEKLKRLFVEHVELVQKLERMGI